MAATSDSYWNPWLKNDLEKATTFEELRNIAIEILTEMQRYSVSIVCGPITNGGLGSIEANLKKFESTIHSLSASGVSIFSQMPFEDKMQEIKKTPYYKGGDHLLETFYQPIFESGFVKRLFFIAGWEASYGAQWEHKVAGGQNIQIIYLDTV